jgi:hypothetical protein
MPEALDEVLDRAGENRFARTRAPIAQSAWREMVGPRIADRSMPVAIERGVLTVRVATSVWATELSLLSTPIIARLRAYGFNVIELRFRVAPIEPAIPLLARPPERRVSRAVPPPAPLPPELAGALRAVGDSELREAIALAARANLAWQAHIVTSAPPASRGPRSSGTRSDPPGRTTEASPGAGRCNPEGARDRRR